MSLELLPETEFFPTALNVKLLYLASPARIVEVAGSPHFVVFFFEFSEGNLSYFVELFPVFFPQLCSLPLFYYWMTLGGY